MGHRPPLRCQHHRPPRPGRAARSDAPGPPGRRGPRRRPRRRPAHRQDAVAEYRADALTLLDSTPLADAEAELAHGAELRSAHRHPTRATALATTEQARATTAQHLLTQRLNAVRELREHADGIRSAATEQTRQEATAR
ncbi:hypothetical protein AB0F92_41870 [Kitasatospora aureofaciens]|uniref:hypothetical protein n=1 Tax=Kitasatospora aureofaciens TaxID=1894 RepID=UPI0033EC9412